MSIVSSSPSTTIFSPYVSPFLEDRPCSFLKYMIRQSCCRLFHLQNIRLKRERSHKNRVPLIQQIFKREYVFPFFVFEVARPISLRLQTRFCMKLCLLLPIQSTFYKFEDVPQKLLVSKEKVKFINPTNIHRHSISLPLEFPSCAIIGLIALYVFHTIKNVVNTYKNLQCTNALCSVQNWSFLVKIPLRISSVAVLTAYGGLISKTAAPTPFEISNFLKHSKTSFAGFYWTFGPHELKVSSI